MLPVECVVRGYISGSGWKDYQATGSVSGIELPEGLRESDRLPEPIYTPSTKADEGHDEAIDFEATVELVGLARAGRAPARHDAGRLRGGRRPRARARGDPRRHEVRVRPRRGRRAGARRRGLHAGLLALLAGRPATSRARASRRSTSSTCATGPPGTGWDKTPPAPAIPDEVVAATRERYVTAYERLAGEPFSRLAGAHGAREGARADPAQGRDPRSPGPGRRARAAGARLRRGQPRPRRPARRAGRRGSGEAAGDVRAAARQPADRGLRDRRGAAT